MKSNELEIKCHELWSDILNSQKNSEQEALFDLDNHKINKQEDFFDLGGTSLSLLELLSETKKRFSVDIRLSAFEHGLSLELYQDLVAKLISKESPNRENTHDHEGKKIRI